MSDRVSVTLTGPAKIGGRWFKPGDAAEVTRAEIGDLVAAGVFAPLDDAALGAAVLDKASQQDLQTQLDAANAALAEVTRDRDELRALHQIAENQITRLEARVLELEDDLNKSEEVRRDLEARLQKTPSESGGQDGNDSPPDASGADVPKTAPKKGAGGKKG